MPQQQIDDTLETTLFTASILLLRASPHADTQPAAMIDDYIYALRDDRWMPHFGHAYTAKCQLLMSMSHSHAERRATCRSFMPLIYEIILIFIEDYLKSSYFLWHWERRLILDDFTRRIRRAIYGSTFERYYAIYFARDISYDRVYILVLRASLHAAMRLSNLSNRCNDIEIFRLLHARHDAPLILLILACSDNSTLQLASPITAAPYYRLGYTSSSVKSISLLPHAFISFLSFYNDFTSQDSAKNYRPIIYYPQNTFISISALIAIYIVTPLSLPPPAFIIRTIFDSLPFEMIS